MNRRIFYAQIEEGDSSAQQNAPSKADDLKAQKAENASKKGKDPAQAGLFAAHKKIFVREVSGTFNRLRWVFVWLTQLLYFVIPWLKWNDRPAVWFDLQKRFFYIFGWTFSPTDVVYMTIVLIICALALFLFTTVAGRLWCGYTCPQTVYTEIFMWIERKVEGNRAAQLRLHKSGWTVGKIVKKIIKHGLWIAFSLVGSFTLVAYFTGAPGSNNGMELVREIMNHETSSAQMFWIGFYGFMMYLFAGFMREQVCKYMCPYARFQGVMFDPDTLIVTYDAERGESRGPRKKSVDPKTLGKGDCIDCGVCVDVCPTGIDIRNGLQYECIGCGACIDGCNEIMDKMGYARGLIRYDTENGVKNKFTKDQLLKRAVRPRVLVYISILLILTIGLVYSIGQRTVIRMVVERDARTIARMSEEGNIENVFRIQLTNTSETPHKVKLSVSGLPGAKIVGKNEFVIDPTTPDVKVIRVQIDPAKARSNGVSDKGVPITIQATSIETGDEVEKDSIYYGM